VEQRRKRRRRRRRRRSRSYLSVTHHSFHMTQLSDM
jgi:5'-deoxynucleotidase YfbR-like HD superfamily hydrolase